MRNRLALLLAFVVLAAAACAGPPEVTLAKANVPRASADPAFAKDAASAINAFGIDLYLRIATGDGNVVVSPASIAIALGMARAGALGTTATEMDAVLRDLATDDHAAWLNALDAALASRTGTFPDATNESQPVTLRTANAPFSQRGMKLVDAYLEALASRYGAGLQLVDYKTESEAARKAINAWVSDQTEKRIPELLVPGTITPDVRLTLVNAIYLKAAWLTPFAEQATKTGAFTRLDGSTVDVPLMHGGGPLPYASGDGWQAVELPYVGSSLALMVIVPDDFASFGKGLTPELLAEITGALEDRAVTLTLPKFGIESKIELAATLAAMGMPTAFEPGLADFSGITTEEQLSISAVIHQANIDVDEKGTTAAAATAIVMRGTAEPGEPITLTVDRPFLFALRDVPTGTVLFLGRVTDPSVKE
jgi:Serine protease inhibitor